ncbi:hypothetical protein [Candidatus Pelagibacter sp. HIMB1321]|uniref:hypothetical protein n=1 Tax=Candidatus Pelagibacter sp. HIMB1321 TaxID=1388755 RepID=UPI000A07DEA2|nr:hypothetical protein [Candidatus Pelagibacter sp. HIMB1321]SMF77394.1 hypothetical protein SAMN02744631_0805 [Candidatus Pelagibacter sp. HIMB1321]
MFGLGKNKSKVVEDESIRDKSKFVVVGFTVMVFSFLLLIISEIYTSLQLSKQNRLIASTGDIQEKSDNIVLEMAKVGRDVNKSEYEYIKEIMMFMSPTEFQNFKNSISGMANEFNVQINSLNESKADQLGKTYSINYIEYQFLSTYENLTFLKNKISETDFKINIIEEEVTRENPTSDKVLAEGKIGVYVFPGKEKLLKDKAKIIEKFKAEEEKLAEKNKNKPENN